MSFSERSYAWSNLVYKSGIGAALLWNQLEEILLMPGGANAARVKRIMDNVEGL